MPIDKIIPRFLVSDEDERLLKEGAMTDALNVTISEDGDGTEGIIKNVKGTTAALCADENQFDVINSTKTIGQVSDPQLGFIYYFCVSSSGTADAIYQYNTKSSINDGLAANSYRAIIESNDLNFDPSGFVKADVLNVVIDGSVNSLLYFTDDRNAPRKINVQRAVDGDYSGVSGSVFKEQVSVIKAANNRFPTVSFETDTNVIQNNFAEDTFQFATQNIFQDGEESAISPYSEIAVSKVLFLNAMETDGFAVSPYIDNVCLVGLELGVHPPDLKEVRLLARRGNSGAFFVVDQFNPNQELSRHIAGADVTVYSPDSETYKFYNNTLGAAVDPTIVNKLYDNVPLVAKGQALSGNRLMYSNYKEGFDNVVTDVTLTVNYSSLSNKDENFIVSADAASIISQNNNNNISVDVDLLAGGSFDSLQVGSATKATIVPSGTLIELEFTWGGDDRDINVAEGIVGGGALNITGNVISSPLVAGYQMSNVTVKSSSPLNLAYADGQATKAISIKYVVSQDQTIEDIGSALSDALTGKQIEYEYTVNETLAPDPESFDNSNYDSWSGVTLTGDIMATFDFSDTQVIDSVGSYGFTINPKLSNVRSLGAAGGTTISAIDNIANANPVFFANPEALTNILAPSSQTGNFGYTTAGLNASSFVTSPSASARITQSQPTFKSGSTHSFGIVYYDEFNRSGFVNELGSCYVKSINERKNSDPAIEELGPASVEITFAHNPPLWAERYQIVYAGPDSMDDYIQYTTGPAFVATSELRDTNSPHNHLTDIENKRLYVSLSNLDSYVEEKNTSRQYSYTKGDRLRLISRRSDDNSADAYPTATDGSQIEFEVVDVVILSASTSPDDATEPIQIVREDNSSVDDKYKGTFLVLEASRINGGETDSESNVVRYTGFDWGDVSGFDLTTGTDSTTGDTTINHWGKQTVVEIYTPKKTTSEKVYYEIGHGARCGSRRGENVNKHGVSITITNGDSWIRPVPCKTALHVDDLDDDIQGIIEDGGTFSAWEARDFYDQYGYKTLFVESNTLSDRFPSRIWSQGRAHVPFEKSKEQRRLNGITYSDAYVEDVSNLSLSSFNPSLANFSSLDAKYGAIDYIGNYNDNLVSLQENKLALIPVNKNILEYASGSADVSISANVINQERYSAGDYGSDGHPEAVLIQDGSVYFVDKSRQAVCALTGGQLVPISEKSMSSFFERFFDTDNDRYVSGYDPRDNIYYITALGGTTPETVGYDASRGAWQSRYSFTPDIYSNQNNMLYSAKHVSVTDALDTIFYKHDNTTDYNTFYGTAESSTVQVVSKLSPSRVKVFNSISYEGDSDAWEMSTGATTNLNQTSGTIHDAADIINTPKFIEKEGGYYAAMSKATDHKYYFVGTIAVGGASNSSLVVTLSDISRIDRFPFFTTGASVFTSDDGETFADNVIGSRVITAFDLAAKTITLNDEPAGAADNKKVYVQVQTNGDALRGNFAKITLTNSSTTKHELYCINTHITDSKSHHPLGQ
tara:strand:+ start:5359 stop:9852 length:4494 start_codon:yes stop_codon:yes gene_type:complete